MSRRYRSTLHLRRGLRALATIAVVVAVVGAVGAVATASEYTLKTFGIEDGLPWTRVYHLFEDSRGFLWVATPGGVTRYDGTDFRTFTRKDGLSHNVVKHTLEDRDHNLWFGTYGGGVCRYDHLEVRCFGVEDGLPDGIVDQTFEDHTGRLWFATNRGVAWREGERFIHYDGHPVLADAAVGWIHEDDAGTLWLATSRGLFTLRRAARGDGLIADKVPIRFENSEAFSWISDDPYGSVWVGGRSTGRFWGWPEQPPLAATLVAARIVVRIVARTREGQLWVGTDENGVLEVTDSGWTEHRLGLGVLGDAVNTILEDRRGNLWVGTDGGLAVLERTAFRTYGRDEGLQGQLVWAISEDQDGRVWLGTDDGLCRVGDDAGVDCTVLGGPRLARIRALERARDGSIWIGARGVGIHVLRDGGLTQLSYDGTDRLLRSVYAVLEDSEGAIWAGTNRRGVFRLKDGDWTGFDVPFGSEVSRVFAIHEGRDGTMWFGTYGGGLGRLDGDRVSVVTESDGLCGNIIMSLAEDRRGTLWIASLGRGICSYDGREFRSYSESDGLSSSTVYLVLVDDRDTLWIGTDKGIDRLDLAALSETGRPSLRHFDVPSGGEYNHNAAYRDSRGYLWFGSTKGALRYDPNADPGGDGAITPSITGVRLFHEPVAWDRVYPTLDRAYGLPLGLELPHDQNHVSFDFAGALLRGPARPRYRYRMAGFEKSWSPASVERSATYSNLGPGRYSFEVQASSDGVDWTGPAARFEFSVRSPFWRTWWFLVAAFATIGLTLLSAVQLRIRQIETRQEQQTEWNRRVAEARLTALRAQMNPHFIFNALNSIQQLILADARDDAQRYLGKFAKLLRSILRGSESTFIPLRTELEQLELYLGMEALRFDEGGLEYRLELDPALDPDRVEIPPMLIQPFAENAIRHGLRHKGYRGSILVELGPGEAGFVRCVIEDDGVGRDEAARIERDAGPLHEPHAMRATEERLQMLNLQGAVRAGAAGVEVIDLFDDDGAPRGTRVELRIPTREVPS